MVLQAGNYNKYGWYHGTLLVPVRTRLVPYPYAHLVWYCLRWSAAGTLFVRLTSGNNEQVLVPITTTTIAVALPSQLSRIKAGRPGLFLPGNGPAPLAAATANSKY